MNRLTDIAQITRNIENQEIKKMIVENWDEVTRLSDDEKSSRELIDAICEEDKDTISVILAL
jgi:hypothetical protein